MLKIHLIKKFSQRMITYFCFRIRRCYTTINRGSDHCIDDSINYIVIERLFSQKISADCGLKNVDEEIKENIISKIDDDTRNEIVKFKEDYEAIIETIFDFSEVDENKQEIRNILRSKKHKLSFLIKSNINIFKKLNREYKYFKDINVIKMTISLNSFASYFGVISIVIIVGSILQQFWISKEFNFFLGMVFDTNDYLASSIKSIIYAIFPIFLTLLLGFITSTHDSNMDNKSKEYNARLSNKSLKFMNLFIIAYIIFNYFFNRENFFMILISFGPLILIKYIAGFIAKYISNFYQIYAISLFLLFFSINMISSTTDIINDIKDENENTISIELNGVSYKNIDSLRYITSGSKGIVFWDIKEEKSIIINPDLIKKIEIGHE